MTVIRGQTTATPLPVIMVPHVWMGTGRSPVSAQLVSKVLSFTTFHCDNFLSLHLHTTKFGNKNVSSEKLSTKWKSIFSLTAV